jgi:type I restriction enzyme M protein
MHFTLVNNPLKRDHLDDFVKAYCPGARAKRKESERFKRFTYAEVTARDKLNLDIFWLKDESLGNHDDLPAPDVIAAEIVENLEAALEAFKDVAAGLPGAKAG